MEEKNMAKSHKLMISNRQNGSFTGVVDVLSFDISEILLETEMGMLHVKGRDLHVNRLNLEKGEVDIEGLIEAFHYSPVPVGIKGKDSLLGKLFH